MQLGKKKEPEQNYDNQPREFKKNVPMDYTKWQVDYDAILPHGKYKGETLRMVRDNDNFYYSWIIQENILTAWGLVKLREEPKKGSLVDKDYFITESGEVWIELYMVERKGPPSPFL